MNANFETEAIYGSGDNGPGGFDEPPYTDSNAPDSNTAGFYIALPIGFALNSITINEVPAPTPDWQGYVGDAPRPQPVPPEIYVFEWLDETIASAGDVIELEFTLNGDCYVASTVVIDV